MKKDTDSKINIHPLADRVLIKRVDVSDTKSPSGIIIPDTATKEKSKIGLVIAAGPGRTSDEGKLIATTIKIGQKVYFNAGWDNEVKLDKSDDEYFLVRESDILGIIK